MMEIFNDLIKIKKPITQLLYAEMANENITGSHHFRSKRNFDFLLRLLKTAISSKLTFLVIVHVSLSIIAMHEVVFD